MVFGWVFFARCGVWWAIIGVSDKFLAGWGAEGLWGPFGEGWGIAGVVHVVFGNISGISGEIQLLFLNYGLLCLPRTEALSPPDLPHQVAMLKDDQIELSSSSPHNKGMDLAKILRCQFWGV